MIKKWFKQLFCKHDWSYEYYTNGIVRLAKSVVK